MEVTVLASLLAGPRDAAAPRGPRVATAGLRLNRHARWLLAGPGQVKSVPAGLRGLALLPQSRVTSLVLAAERCPAVVPSAAGPRRRQRTTQADPPSETVQHSGGWQADAGLLTVTSSGERQRRGRRRSVATHWQAARPRRSQGQS